MPVTARIITIFSVNRMGWQKYMKFPMFKKETTDRNYHEDPFRAVNFKIDGDGKMWCPNGKGFHLQYRKAIKENAYGREEEIYQCEDCSGCPYAAKNVKKGRRKPYRACQSGTNKDASGSDSKP